jgi:hypothetical protein
MKRLKRRAIREEVTTLLGDLGGTAQEVAAGLATAGVRGIPRDRHQCAVARYLNAVVGADPQLGRVVVGSSRLWVRSRRWWSITAVLDPPIPVPQFNSGFDRESYTELTAVPGPSRTSLLSGV